MVDNGSGGFGIGGLSGESLPGDIRRKEMDLSTRAAQELGEKSRIVVEADLLDHLTDGINQGSQTEMSAALGYSSISTLNGVLHGRRGVSAGLARKMGWEKKVIFVRSAMKGEE